VIGGTVAAVWRGWEPAVRRPGTCPARVCAATSPVAWRGGRRRGPWGGGAATVRNALLDRLHIGFWTVDW